MHEPRAGIYRRIIVFGHSGAGKTRLAALLAEELKAPCINMDDLRRSTRSSQAGQSFMEATQQLVAGEYWVMDGSYEAVQHLTWSRATLIVWLDLSPGVVAWRMSKRIFGRAVGFDRDGATAGSRGNREARLKTLGSALERLGGHFTRRRRHLEALYSPDSSGVAVHRLCTASEVDTWMRLVRSTL